MPRSDLEFKIEKAGNLVAMAESAVRSLHVQFIAESWGRDVGVANLIALKYIDGCHAFDCINYSLVTPVRRQTQSDGY